MNNKQLLLGLALTSLVGASHAQSPSSSADLSDGKSQISARELAYELSGLTKAARESLLRDKRALSRYVTTVLLNRRIAAEAERDGLHETSEFKAELAKARRESLVRLYTERKFDEASATTPPDSILLPLARETYLANQASYRLPEKRDYVHLLIKVDPEAGPEQEKEAERRAAELLKQVKAGASLEQLASQYSDDEKSKKNNGRSVQPVTRGQTVPPFDRALFSMEIGQISELVRTRFGFHIIKLAAIEPARTRSFEEVASEILKSMKTQRATDARDKIMMQFQGPDTIEISDEFMQELNRIR